MGEQNVLCTYDAILLSFNIILFGNLWKLFNRWTVRTQGLNGRGPWEGDKSRTDNTQVSDVDADVDVWVVGGASL